MTARFEVFSEPDARFRFRLVDKDGNLMLISNTYENEDEAIAGIWSLRETVASGRIVDLTDSIPEAQ